MCYYLIWNWSCILCRRDTWSGSIQGGLSIVSFINSIKWLLAQPQHEEAERNSSTNVQMFTNVCTKMYFSCLLKCTLCSEYFSPFQTNPVNSFFSFRILCSSRQHSQHLWSNSFIFKAKLSTNNSQVPPSLFSSTRRGSVERVAL